MLQMRLACQLALLALLTAPLAPASAPPGSPAAAAPPPAEAACPLLWRTVTSPNVANCGDFYALGAHTAGDIWAVGATGCPGSLGLGLIEHWDGQTWSVVPGPGTDEILTGVAAIAADDAWVVGSGDTGEPPFLAHWDGQRWAQVPPPVPDGELAAVAAVAAGDVWAVGNRQVGSQPVPLVLHWDGARWSEVPAYAGTGLLSGVAARAANDVWAVGQVGFGAGAPYQTLVEHWDGTAWHQVPSPSPDPAASSLHQVAILPLGQAWAVGYTGAFGSAAPLTLHWDGVTWTAVPAPVAGAATYLWGVAGSGPADVWATGEVRDAAGTSRQAVILHWDGTAWQPAAAPVLPGATSLWAVAALGAGDVWAVGTHEDPGHTTVQTLVAHYADAGTFVDVPAGAHYSSAVHDLACRGILSGYGDSNFRPAAPTTRGQIARIVVGARGWPLSPPAGPHFHDVPAGSPFYEVVETAYAHGIISGYGDGTFRPGAGVTRAQLCKLVVGAWAWPVDTSGGPHFADVPPADPFYTVVETAYHHGVIAGYADGTFRPGAGATRGQTAKIIQGALAAP